MCVPDKSGDFILLCMKIVIFTKITLLFPKIKCEPQESNAVGKADFLTELKSSEFSHYDGQSSS
jgi:hypothetical protein